MQKSKVHTEGMQSRIQVVHRLRALHFFSFIGYIEQVEHDVHLVRLAYFITKDNGLFKERIVKEMYVTECPGYLRAVSTDGTFSVSKLT